MMEPKKRKKISKETAIKKSKGRLCEPGTNPKLPEALQKNIWAPGQSGNPKGRPKGARNRLCTEFIEAFYADWQSYGNDTIVKVREEDPVAYVKIIAAMIPRDVNLKIDPLDEMTDEQLRNRARDLAKYLGIFGGVEGAGADSGNDKTAGSQEQAGDVPPVH